MRIVAVIQARMGSTRLPGKVMLSLCGRTVLEHVIVRVRSCPLVDEVVVATTTSPADDVIVQEATRCGVHSYRGSEEDVLGRYCESAEKFRADLVVRATSDCPLFDPDLLSSMLGEYLKRVKKGEGIDYLSNTIHRTFPRGLDAEIFTREALVRACREATAPADREHVTPYIWQNPEIFRLQPFTGEVDLSSNRWTLDTMDDFRFLESVYQALYHDGEIFRTDAVLKLLRAQPHLSLLNAHVEQKPVSG